LKDIRVLLTVVQQYRDLAVADVLQRTFIEDALPYIRLALVPIEVHHVAGTEVEG
jgi:hypothetical protein